MPNSPISLRLTSTSHQFVFFSKAFAIYDKVLRGSVLPPDINAEVYEQLRFTFSTTDSITVSRVSFSVTQIKILTHCVAEICTLLTGNNYDAFKATCDNELPLLANNWDKKFIDCTRKTFTKYQDRFGELPEFTLVLTIVSDSTNKVTFA